MEKGRGSKAFNEGDLRSIQGENRGSYDPATAGGGDVIGKEYGRSGATKPAGAGIEIVEGDKIWAAAGDTGGCQSEHDVVIGAIGGRASIEGKLGRIHIWANTASQSNVPIAVLGFSGGSRRGIGTAEDIRIRRLPTLHRLMKNTRFPVNQVWVQSERIAAKHDMALGPVLRNSVVPGSSRFLSGHTQHENETHHTPTRNSNIRMRRLHVYLRWQWIGPIV